MIAAQFTWTTCRGHRRRRRRPPLALQPGGGDPAPVVRHGTEVRWLGVVHSGPDGIPPGVDLRNLGARATRDEKGVDAPEAGLKKDFHTMLQATVMAVGSRDELPQLRKPSTQMTYGGRCSTCFSRPSCMMWSMDQARRNEIGDRWVDVDLMPPGYCSTGVDDALCNLPSRRSRVPGPAERSGAIPSAPQGVKP